MASSSSWWESVLEFTRQNETLIELAVFALGFAESLVFVSFFIPASALFLGIAALEGAAGNPIVPIVIAGTAGCFAGDMVSFVIGSRLKGNLRETWPFRKNPQWLTCTQDLFERRGIVAIIVSKFIGPLRPVVPFVAGASHMPLAPFAGASAVSSLAWSVSFLLPAYYGVAWLAG